MCKYFASAWQTSFDLALFPLRTIDHKYKLRQVIVKHPNNTFQCMWGVSALKHLWGVNIAQPVTNTATDITRHFEINNIYHISQIICETCISLLSADNGSNEL